VHEADVLVPLSREELRRKILAIFKHQSQKDVAPFPGAYDEREFWQRVEHATRRPRARWIASACPSSRRRGVRGARVGLRATWPRRAHRPLVHAAAHHGELTLALGVHRARRRRPRRVHRGCHRLRPAARRTAAGRPRLLPRRPRMAWWAICFSVVATETSALTFISVPATAYQTDFWMLQLAAGYLVGRIVVAYLLLPRYFAASWSRRTSCSKRGSASTARRFASCIFLVTRAFADSVRIFAAAIPIALITAMLDLAVHCHRRRVHARLHVLRRPARRDLGRRGADGPLRVRRNGRAGRAGAAGARRLERNRRGRRRQASCACCTCTSRGGRLRERALAPHRSDRRRVPVHGIPRRRPPHRAAAARRKIARGARRALDRQRRARHRRSSRCSCSSGVGLYAYYRGSVFARRTRSFLRFIVEGLPPGLSGLIVAGILAAMMSTVSSSLNSLAHRPRTTSTCR
jgi:hypothetical protein